MGLIAGEHMIIKAVQMDDTIRLVETSQEATVMLAVCAKALNGFGLELDVPEAGTAMDPNQPGAKMTA